MPGEDPYFILRQLNRKTPKEDDLTIFETPEEAWRYLDGKYSNPLVVSSTLIDEFL